MNILFICTGNTCRSPLAEKILIEKAKEKNLNIHVKSAGIAANNGQTASRHAREVIKELGADDQHQAKQATEELLNWADLILTMTVGHKQFLIAQKPEITPKIYTLKELVLVQGADSQQVPSSLDIIDPYGQDLATYRRTAEEISEFLEYLLAADLLSKKEK